MVNALDVSVVSTSFVLNVFYGSGFNAGVWTAALLDELGAATLASAIGAALTSCIFLATFGSSLIIRS